MAIFGQMKDPRRRTKGNFKHELVEVVFLVISAVVSGCNDWETISVFGESQLEWLRKYYPYKNGLPSHDTINRLFSAMDSKVFGRYFIKWTQEICTLSDGDIVAIDGNINVMLRDDGVLINSTIVNNQLILKFTVTGVSEGGRVEGVDGEYHFVLQNQ